MSDEQAVRLERVCKSYVLKGRDVPVLHRDLSLRRAGTARRSGRAERSGQDRPPSGSSQRW